MCHNNSVEIVAVATWYVIDDGQMDIFQTVVLEFLKLQLCVF